MNKSPLGPAANELSWARKYRNELGLMVAIVVVVALTMLRNDSYRQEPWENLRDILRETSLLGIFALGAAIIIISGGIDLSAGSTIVFSGSICGLVMMLLAPLGDNGLPAPQQLGVVPVLIAIGAALLVGVIVGTLHAWLITVVELPPFVATLASLVGLRSLAKILNQAVTLQLGNQQTTIRTDAAVFALLKPWWVPLVIFLTLGACFWFLMNRTVIGRHIYALGGNEQAAKLSGIRTNGLKWFAYTIGSVTACIAGILYTAKIGSANPSTLAIGYELNAIAAAVVGGCSLQGGVGLIPGVMLGVLFLRVVIDSVAKVVKAGSDDYQGLIVGFLVVLAVAFNELRRQTRARQKLFFQGTLGLATIPILSMLVGAITFVLRQNMVGRDAKLGGWGAGLIAFMGCALVLSATRQLEKRRHVVTATGTRQ